MHTTTWMNLKNVMLCRSRPKNIHHDSSDMNLKTGKTNHGVHMRTVITGEAVLGREYRELSGAVTMLYLSRDVGYIRYTWVFIKVVELYT